MRRSRGTPSGDSGTPSSAIPTAFPSTSTPRADLRAGAVGLVAALGLFAIFLFSYAGALHDPQPRGVPIGIVGSNVPVGLNVADTRFAAVAVSRARIRSEILNRHLAGVLDRPRQTLYVASAASYTTAQYLQAVARPKHVVDLRPLPPGDSRGITLFYAAIALVFGGYFAATVITTLISPASPTHSGALVRIGALAGFSVVSGFVCALLLDQAIGAIHGRFLALNAVSILAVFATGAATAALQSLLGIAGTLVAMIAFVMLGNSSSGGAYQRTFTPSFWDAIGPWLPTGAAVSALRAGVYFDWRNCAGRLLVLAGYAVAGAAVTIALGRRRGRRLAEAEVALAAGSV